MIKVHGLILVQGSRFMIKKHNKYEDESLIKVKNKDLLGTISTKIAYFAV